MKLVREKIKAVASTSQRSGLFRVCSIGCGDGLVDNDILSAVAQGCPDRTIHYVGLDISQVYCGHAKENIKPASNVQVQIINQNFLDFTDEPFDFIIAVHSLYYLPSPEEGIKKILSMLKENGERVIKCVIIIGDC